MKIKELIEILSELDENKEVLVGYDNIATEPIEQVSLEEGPGGANHAVIWGWPGRYNKTVPRWQMP